MSTVGEKIKTKREQLGWSQADLARRVGVSQATIEKIEKGQTTKSRYLPDVAHAIGLDMGEVDSKFSAQSKEPFQSEAVTLGERNLPVYAAAEGGNGAMVLSTDPVDFIVRPSPLANVKDAYAVIIVSDSMYPEMKPGDTAFVHPHLPPVPGECCVFYADDGHGTVIATIKSFVRRTETHWHVEQWNPPKKFSLLRSEWQKCHRVVGKYSGR